MPRRDVWVLRAFAGWSLLVWGVLTRNMLFRSDRGWGFRAVHLVLAAVSLSFAVATFLIAQRAAHPTRRREPEPEREPSRR